MQALKEVLAKLNDSDRKTQVFLATVIGLFEGVAISSKTIATQLGVSHIQVFGILQSFEARSVNTSTESSFQGFELTAEGKTCVENGSPAFRVYQVVKAAEAAGSPISREKLIEDLGEVGSFGFARAMKSKWVKLEGGVLVSTADVAADEDKTVLDQIIALGEEAFTTVENNKDLKNTVTDLIKRKLISQVKSTVRDNLQKGTLFEQNVAEALRIAAANGTTFDAVKPESTISTEMVQKGAWKTTAFKPLNFAAAGRLPKGGNLHPLLKVRAQFRRILMQMGFEEMPTDRWVESSFWNFDSLFQPQQHPARDAHDTFFVDPAFANKDKIPQDYFEIVRKTHEEGGFGSLGWRYVWSEKEALSTVLRTHTTAVSSRMLYRLAKETEEQGIFTPRKYFSIDRVFRNEKLDATHLAEFQQVEGLIADRNLSLADLKGVIREFFAKIGITQLWFKPAFNPYTEPSMEIFGYHPILKKRVELGNSGIFRPEMLRPMGLPADVRVIAWGLSLERPTMINYSIDNIRDLSGHRVDLAKLRKNPVCWMD